MEWLHKFFSLMSAMEWVAFLTNVVCVYLIVKEQDINWPVGVLGSAALLYVFWKIRLYAQVGLQAFYVVECLYGWWMWTRRDRSTGVKLIRIGKTNRQTFAWLALIGVIATPAMWWLFLKTGDPAPFWDSLITVASLIAEYMLCLKLLESWALYFGADVVSLVVLALLGQWVTFGTYWCFTLLCLMGIREWLKRWKLARLPGFPVLPVGTADLEPAAGAAGTGTSGGAP
jgi:nicotinamide mononucleotide transporter